MTIEQPTLPWAEGWFTDLPGEGWWPIIAALDADLREMYPDYRVLQVKEKFGGLRFYIAPVTESTYRQVYDRIHTAEAISYKVCEWCGEPGKERGGGWIKTLCDIHNEERGKR